MLSNLYQQNLTLLTDLYQLTMAYGYWKNKLHQREAVFHLYYRKNPFKGDYAIAAGLDLAIDYLKNLQFEASDIDYLASLTGSDNKPLFEIGFLDYLRNFKFSCDIAAIPEGTITFPNQPLIKVKGPLLQAQLIETALLNIINFSSLIATKASRIVQATKGEPVLEFGLRRTQGIDGGITASRAAYIGGCAATSNVLAGKLFNIPVKGTHAHSWVMTFEDEIEAFSKYALAMPANCIFLVDTYDTVEGVKKAIEVGKKLREKGHDLAGIRLDSGDLADLSIKARHLLDTAGFEKTNIVASNDLDEYRIKDLKEKGAKINVWGVGTRLSTAYDQPALGGVYKLAAIKDEWGNWEHKVKLSEQAIKTSTPGIQQVKRCFENDLPVGDIIYDELDIPNKWEVLDHPTQSKIKVEATSKKNLLIPIFKAGKLIYQSPSLKEIRTFANSQMNLFKNIDIAVYPNGIASNLHQKKLTIINNSNYTQIS